MKLLLDTHVLLWWLEGDSKLKPVDRDRIAETSNEICVSAASAYEVALKANLGRLDWNVDVLRAAIGVEGFQVIDVTWRHFVEAGQLPLAHRDPFDRIIAAQAIIEGMLVATGDKKLAKLVEDRRR